MFQKKLYRTIESIASRKFNSDEELMSSVLEKIVSNEEINVTGGRIWQLITDKKGYKIMHQTGSVQKIADDFYLFVKHYPILDLIAEERTVLSTETNRILKEKGIFRFSASGIGLRRNIDGKKYYEFLLALNSDKIDDDLRYTLNIVATVLTSKLIARRASESKKNLIADIDRAKQLQKSLLPEHEHQFYNYDLFGVTVPAKTLGGDFYDYVKIGDDEQRLAIVVGDAASKGLDAAAEAMYISGAIRMASTFQMKISPFMNRINELVNKIFSDDRFISLFYGEISTDRKGLFLYANAGHNPPIMYSKKKKDFILLEPTGPLLGPAPHSKYETDSVNFSPGDLLVIYSDGIVEAADDKYDFYEEKRLKEVIIRNIDKSPKELTYAILQDVTQFSTENSQYQDDKTVVVIKRKESDEFGR